MSLQSILTACFSGLSRRRPAQRPRGFQPHLEALEDRALPSAYSAATVSALVADISAANTARGANTITLTAPSSSPYRLTAQLSIAANDNLTIVGAGDTIEGTVGVGQHGIDVAAGASLTLENLTLQSFVTHEALQGAAIYSQGALTLSAVTVKNNGEAGVVLGGGTAALGGAIWSNGSLILENGTLFMDNIARGEATVYGPGGNAYGGAVYIAGGTANISDTTFTANVAAAGEGEGLRNDGTACGGAVYVGGGQVVISNTSMTGNQVLELGYVGDVCYGGALYVAGGNVTVANCTLGSNTTSTTGYGGGLGVAGGTVILTNDTIESNSATHGGGIYIAPPATVSIDPFTVANTVNNTDSSGTNGSTANIDGSYVLT